MLQDGTTRTFHYRSVNRHNLPEEHKMLLLNAFSANPLLESCSEEIKCGRNVSFEVIHQKC